MDEIIKKFEKDYKDTSSGIDNYHTFCDIRNRLEGAYQEGYSEGYTDCSLEEDY